MDFVNLFVRPIRVGGVHKFGLREVLLDKVLHAGRQCQHLLVLVLVQIDGIRRCHHVLQLSFLRIGVLRKQQPRAFFSDIHGLESPLFAVIKVKEFCYISVARRYFFIQKTTEDLFQPPPGWNRSFCLRKDQVNELATITRFVFRSHIEAHV